MSKKEPIIKVIILSVIKSLLFAILFSMILGYFMGYKLILVNGWSAEPYISYQSLIMTAKVDLSELELGDFVTTKTASYVTHQLIAVKYDGYFEIGEKISMVIKGENHFMYWGYSKVDKEIDDEENARDNSITDSTQCNIITMQQSSDLDATKEYRNYNKNFVGKVVIANYTLGKTIFTVKENPFILIGLFVCLMLVYVIRDEFNIDPTFSRS